MALSERSAWKRGVWLAGAVLALCAQPAVVLAGEAGDVKAGVDAWSAGDFARAVKEWQAGADRGDPDAQFNLGQAYRLGRGVPADMRKAEYYYSKAATQGHMQAADNYGLILFQDGRRDTALPYIKAASERGDPRAQYLLGIAHFNGDLVPKDWVRAYALVSLSNGAGLPQAAPALAQMDQYIPLDQRQAATSLATRLQSQADATRARQLASLDLGSTAVAPATSGLPRAIEPAAMPASTAPSAAALPHAGRTAVLQGPASAGADYARPVERHSPAAPMSVPPVSRPPAQQTAASVPPAQQAAGQWRVQLGAFSVRANADRLWNQIGGKGPLSGKTKMTENAGNLTKLFAGGFASNAAAASACAALKAQGQGCLVVK